ncbi:MAG: GNAT family protein [Eubacteriales bacterium]|nr:GNAT family protein [Eubacteriales bacterium]
MQLRPYNHTEDYRYIKKWIDSERTHCLWCANLLPYPLTEKNLKEFLARDAQMNGGTAYIAAQEREHGRPVGFFVYSANRAGQSGFLKLVLMDSELRGRGYGTQMMKLALEQAFADADVLSVQLNVFDVNSAARKCYLNAGFAVLSVKEGTFSYKNECWGKCCMEALRSSR